MKSLIWPKRVLLLLVIFLLLGLAVVLWVRLLDFLMP